MSPIPYVAKDDPKLLCTSQVLRLEVYPTKFSFYASTLPTEPHKIIFKVLLLVKE